MWARRLSLYSLKQHRRPLSARFLLALARSTRHIEFLHAPLAEMEAVHQSLPANVDGIDIAVTTTCTLNTMRFVISLSRRTLILSFHMPGFEGSDS